MTTREHIERLTDAGLFERLCVSIIRKLKPELNGILETGTNSQGKTIGAPVDGFVQVNQNRFVSVHHTTTGKSNLKSKWLGKDEDLEKTAKEISRLRRNFPEGKFELILSTVHVPPVKLQTEVIEKGCELGLTIEFLDQSSIADFLDNNASGQWLRKQYLQIDYVLLSKEALSDISDQDLNNYRNNFYLPQVDQMIQRPVETFPKSGIQPIVGKQGYGKSAFSFQLAIKLAEKECRSIIWIDPQYVSKAQSFEELLRVKLRKLVPNLYLDSKDSWYNSELWKNAVFIIDDLNRIDNSNGVLRKIVQWNSDSFLKEWGLIFIIPLWEDTFDRSFGIKEVLNQPIHLEKYSLSESREILDASLKKVDPSVDLFNIDRVAHELGYDPLLIDLFNKLIGSKQYTDFREMPQNVIQEYIESTLSSLSNSSSEILPNEFSDSLEFLGDEMLQRKEMSPSYRDITSWFKNPELLKAFKVLAKDGRILSINSETQLIFRHDRVKDEVLSKCMDTSFSNYHNDWRFSELYYGRYIGKCLIGQALDETKLRWFLEFNPIAQFEAIRISPGSILTKENVDQISSWIKTDLETEVMSNVKERIKSLLLYTDSEGITPLVESFNYWDRTLVLAGMKNGSLKAAITFFHHFLMFGMSSLENLCFERFKSNHKNLVKGLIELLNKGDASTKRIIGILGIFTYLKNEELIQSIIELWNKLLTSKIEIYDSLTTAFFACGGELNSSFCQTLVDYYELNHRSIKNHPSLSNLPWSDSEIGFLIKKCKEDKAWERLFYNVLYSSSSFKALKYNIEKYSEEQDHVNVEKILTEYQHEAQVFYNYSQQWGSSYDRKDLTTESIVYLRSLFQNESESKLKRWFAFEVWENSVKNDDLELLRKIDQRSFLFPKAFRRRILLGDYDCVPLFSDQLKSNPSLIFLSSDIWCKEVKSELNSILKGLKSNRFLDSSKIDGYSRFSYLFYEIPIVDAEDLLKENWADLRLINEFIKICLYLDSQVLNDLAYDSISRIEEKSQIFNGISWTFQSNVKGRSQFLTVDKLERLKPFLEYIPETEIHFLIDLNNKETFEWWRENVPDSYKSFWGRCYFPDDDNIRGDFQRLSKEEEGSLLLDYFIQDLVKYGISNKRILRNLDDWLQSKRSIKINEFKLACHVVFMIGSRRDLDILRKWIEKVDGDPSTLLKDAEDGVCIHSLI